MEPGTALGFALIAAFILRIAIRVRRGDYKKHMKFRAPAEYAGTGITDTWSAQTCGPKDLQDRVIPDKPPAPDTQDLQRRKAAALEKVLERIRKTDGLTESSKADIKTLESGLGSIREGIEKAKGRAVENGTCVRMEYAQSRTEWIIKAYPRLRNDPEMLSLRREIADINTQMRNR